jgi:molybdopterin molybdotransferase/putative molybdopterin biosynthesis protein
VRYADFEAGMPDTSQWQCGKEYIFCNTGIGIADTYDSVIRIEDVDIGEDGVLKVLRTPEKGQCTIPVGSWVEEGDLILKKHSRLTPLGMAALGLGGHAVVKVFKKPVVAFLPSGNELREPGRSLERSQNVDTNSVMIMVKILQWGGEPLMYPISPDEPERLKELLADAVSKADIVVINAGSSKGTDDFTVEVLESAGTILCHEVDHGPGKHTSYTIGTGGTPIVGLSGPPGGAESTADFYLRPLIDTYLCQPVTAAPRIKARLVSDAVSGKTVEFIMRMFVKQMEDGSYTAKPLPFAAKLDIVSMDKANGFLRIPPSHIYRAGEIVEIELRYPYRWIE